MTLNYGQRSLNNQLGSSNSKGRVSSKTCLNNNNNNSTDFRLWSTDTSILREAIYEHIRQGKFTKNVLIAPDEIYQSLFSDREKIIHALKRRLEHFIGPEEMKTLMNPNQHLCQVQDEPKNNNNCPSSTVTDVLSDEYHILPFKELYKSLLNDQDKIIHGLTNRLKNLISDEDLKMLLDVKDKCFEPRNNRDQIYCMFSRILVNVKDSVSNFLFNKRVQNDTQLNKPVSCNVPNCKMSIAHDDDQMKNVGIKNKKNNNQLHIGEAESNVHCQKKYETNDKADFDEKNSLQTPLPTENIPKKCGCQLIQANNDNNCSPTCLKKLQEVFVENKRLKNELNWTRQEVKMTEQKFNIASLSIKRVHNF